MQSFTYLQYKDQWNHQDSKLYGHCSTMIPRPEEIKKGIMYLFLDVAVNSSIYIHTPGMLLTYPTKKITFFGDEMLIRNDIEVGKSYDWDVTYELHELKGTSI